MSDKHYAIAKIESTMLGYEDHGILTTYLTVKYDQSAVQGVGGYCLDEPLRSDSGKFIGRIGTAYGCEWIARTIKACGVSSWEKIPGRTIYVVCDSADVWKRKIIGIAPLPTEPGEEFKYDLSFEIVTQAAFSDEVRTIGGLKVIIPLQ